MTNDENLNPDDVAEQKGELLPDREAMSLIATDPHAYGGLLGTTPADGTAPTADQAPGVASGAADPATHTAGDAVAAHPPAGTYSPNESATANS
jgi:hypothetical protein